MMKRNLILVITLIIFSLSCATFTELTGVEIPTAVPSGVTATNTKDFPTLVETEAAATDTIKPIQETRIAEKTEQASPQPSQTQSETQASSGGGATSIPCTPTLPAEKPNKDAYQTIIEPFEIVAPSGNRLYGLIRRPDPQEYPELCFPAVVLVPGGINPGRMLAHGRDAEVLSGSGMVVATFNAEGRVDESPDDILSEGTEDYNGFRQQDGLCAIVSYIMEQPYVIPENVGISTQSYGITMGAGCVGRYPEIPIKYLVDGEGPSCSFTTCHGPRFLAGDLGKYHSVKNIFPHLAIWQDRSQENLEWWAQREADQLIGAFRGYYLRLQATWDHAQPPDNEAQIARFYRPDGWTEGAPAWWHNKHAADMVNAAVNGGVPWVRVNLPPQGNPVNATYDAEHMPVFLPDKLADRPWSVQAILEMVNIKE
jgi:hypothetical protein